MRVALVDDSVLFRQGLAALLRDSDIEVVQEARDGAELVAGIAATAPDAVVLDVRMPPTFTDEGLVVAEKLRAAHPRLGVLVLSTYVETAWAMRLLGEGATGVGYLLKDRVADVDTLHDALSRVCKGGCVVDPEVVSRLVQRPRRRPLDELTMREREVLGLMAEGRSNAGISQRLHLSPKTVEAYVAACFGKLGLTQGGDDNRRVLAVLTWLREA